MVVRILKEVIHSVGWFNKQGMLSIMKAYLHLRLGVVRVRIVYLDGLYFTYHHHSCHNMNFPTTLERSAPCDSKVGSTIQTSPSGTSNNKEFPAIKPPPVTTAKPGGDYFLTTKERANRTNNVSRPS